MSDKKLKVKLVKSVIGSKKDIRATVDALGLRKMNYERLHDDTPQVRGMIFKVKHLVSVEEVTE